MIRPDLAARVLVVTASALLLVSAFTPVMRWSVNAAHSTAGSARVFLGGGWTLADGGFGGEQLLPVTLAAGVAWGPVALLRRHALARWAAIVLGAIALYYPVWVAIVFARKWEDDVDPAYGAGLLALAVVAAAAGTTIATRRSRDAADAVA